MGLPINLMKFGALSFSGVTFGAHSRVSAKEVGKILDKLNIEPSANLTVTDAVEARVGAVQLLYRKYVSLSEYIIDMNVYVSDAVNRRCQLVCFPAFAGLLPLSFAPRFNPTALLPDPDTGLPDMYALNACLSDCSDFAFDAFLHTMSALAARHRVYIMAGSTLYFKEAELLHQAFLFSDKGDLLGFQDKLSCSRLENGLEIDPAGELKVFDTPIGPVCILIGSDARHFEMAQAAKRMGALMLLNPTVFAREYTPMDAADGLNLRVQEGGIYGVQSTLVGETPGYILDGPACIFAPYTLAGRYSNTGVLNRSNGGAEPDIAVSSLNMAALDSLSDPYNDDQNSELFSKYYDRLY